MTMKDFKGVPVVAPVDFSDAADQGVQTAIELSGDPTRVTIVHVTTPVIIVEPVAYDILDDEERCNQLEVALKKRYSASNYQGVKFAVRVGDPGIEIVKVAESLNAGLIVMPSHGRTGLAHLLLGSVAERVVRTANRPVLILRRKSVIVERQ
jgi:nucleotide-binding universal stress UspA family protein